MSETPPERRGGGGNILTQKLGPLPGWAWLAIGVGGAGLVIWWRRRKASASASTSATGTPASSGCTDASGNPIDCGSASAVSDPGTAQWEALYTQQQGMDSTLQNIYALLQGTQGSATTPDGGPTGTTGSAGGTGNGGGTPPPGGGGGGGVTQYSAPGSLSVRADNSTTIAVSWTPSAPAAMSYTIAVYQMNGKQIGGNHTVLATTGQQKITSSVAGLTPGYQYQVHVWANGGTSAPPHASATVTMPGK